MEPVEVYSICKESLKKIRVLFIHYEKYHDCAPANYLAETKNDILRKVAHAFITLMMKTNKGMVFNNLFLISGEEDIQMVADTPSLFIDHILNYLEKYKELVIDMLYGTTAENKTTYLFNFESNVRDAVQLINHMEQLILKSQVIHQTYYMDAA